MVQAEGRRVLVTGGTGFIGSHLVEKLLRNGYAVTCLARDLREARTLKLPYGAAYLVGLAAEIGSLFTGKPALANRQKVPEAAQRYWLCALGKSERELGFRADYPLQKGLELTWQWYRKNHWL